MTTEEKATALHEGGMNCAQSVLCALEEHTRLGRCTAAGVSAGFGGGVRCGECCGALTGGVMAIGLAEALCGETGGKKNDPAAVLTNQLTEAFRGEFGCVRCAELQERYGRQGCPRMIRFAAKTAEAILNDNQ